MTRFADIYGAAALMGCLGTIDRMQPWQFAAAWKAYETVNAPPSSAGAPSDEQFRAAVARSMH